jgi:hypothetical protein
LTVVGICTSRAADRVCVLRDRAISQRGAHARGGRDPRAIVAMLRAGP